MYTYQVTYYAWTIFFVWLSSVQLCFCFLLGSETFPKDSRNGKGRKQCAEPKIKIRKSNIEPRM